MPPIWLDADGDRVLDEWLGSGPPDPATVAEVQELLDDITWGRDWTSRWHVTHDLIIPSDWIVTLQDGLRLVIRPFSDEDPERMFTIVRIIPAPL